VFLLSVGFLLAKVAGDPVPLAVIQCAGSNGCESVQYEEREPENEQKEAAVRVQGQAGIEPVSGGNTLLASAMQLHAYSSGIAERKQQPVGRSVDVFGEVVP
jgi:hypothetical protein